MTRYKLVDKKPADGLEFDVDGTIVDSYQVSTTRVRFVVEVDADSPSSEPSGVQQPQESDYNEQAVRIKLNDWSYRDVQSAAKEFDIKANQTKQELIDALVNEGYEP